jgi:hypothetical protein
MAAPVSFIRLLCGTRGDRNQPIEQRRIALAVATGAPIGVAEPSIRFLSPSEIASPFDGFDPKVGQGQS